jgi:hypothetical protein
MPAVIFYTDGCSVNDDSILERPLPHSLEAERAILGAIMLGGPGADEAVARVQVPDFFIPEHRVVLRHLKALHDQGKPTDDPVLLHESLETNNDLEAAGGVAYVSRIPDGMPRISNILHYLEIVESTAQVRRCAHTAHAIRELALGANGDAAEVLRKIADLSAPLREGLGQKRILNFKSGTDLAKEGADQIEWIAEAYVARGAITELGAKVKVGKTTLLLCLVRAAVEGLEFLGKPTSPTPTVYLTEQPTTSFRQSIQRANLLSRDDFRILFYCDVSTIPWPEVAAAAVKECKRIGATLLVVDTLSQFAGLKGDSENNSGDALEAMLPLQLAASAGIGIIIVRHERKAGGEVGDSGRGSSAFAGAVDIVLSLRKPSGNSKKTMRVIQGISRFSETPADLLVELTESGYVALGKPQDAAVSEAKESILAIAPKSEAEAFALKEFVDTSEIPRATVQRALNELTEEGALARVGQGKRGDPFRYSLAENRFCPTSTVGGQKES